MSVITKEEALKRLTKEVEHHLDAYDLHGIYNDLFPKNRTTIDEARTNPAPLIARIVAEINRGLEPEEIVDMWDLVFPKHRNVWYEETEGMIHYQNETESQYTDW
jgi:hypothetical protein